MFPIKLTNRSWFEEVPTSLCEIVDWDKWPRNLPIDDGYLLEAQDLIASVLERAVAKVTGDMVLHRVSRLRGLRLLKDNPHVLVQVLRHAFKSNPNLMATISSDRIRQLLVVAARQAGVSPIYYSGRRLLVPLNVSMLINQLLVDTDNPESDRADLSELFSHIAGMILAGRLPQIILEDQLIWVLIMSGNEGIEQAKKIKFLVLSDTIKRRYGVGFDGIQSMIEPDESMDVQGLIDELSGMLRDVPVEKPTVSPTVMIGLPGAGKSTLVNSLAELLRDQMGNFVIPETASYGFSGIGERLLLQSSLNGTRMFDLPDEWGETPLSSTMLMGFQSDVLSDGMDYTHLEGLINYMLIGLTRLSRLQTNLIGPLGDGGMRVIMIGHFYNLIAYICASARIREVPVNVLKLLDLLSLPGELYVFVEPPPALRMQWLSADPQPKRTQALEVDEYVQSCIESIKRHLISAGKEVITFDPSRDDKGDLVAKISGGAKGVDSEVFLQEVQRWISQIMGKFVTVVDPTEKPSVETAQMAIDLLQIVAYSNQPEQVMQSLEEIHKGKETFQEALIQLVALGRGALSELIGNILDDESISDLDREWLIEEQKCLDEALWVSERYYGMGGDNRVVKIETDVLSNLSELSVRLKGFPKWGTIEDAKIDLVLLLGRVQTVIQELTANGFLEWVLDDPQGFMPNDWTIRDVFD